jgi:acetyltransferase-like isoleucine patch superfamily enzyme
MARTIRAVHRAATNFTLPAPRIIVVPWLYLYLGIRSVIFFIRRIFFAEPLLKAYCKSHGKGVTTGIYVPWVKGRGELVLGDYVRVDGKVSIAFGARFVERPRLSLGNYSGIGHDTSFVVGREIRIGSHVRIAAGVSFRDSGGHASDPTLRKAGAPPDEEDVRAIVIHDNVWIGGGVLVLPGTEIGEGSIIAARSVVSGVVAPYTIVAGNPARRVGNLTPPAAATPGGDTAAATPAPAAPSTPTPSETPTEASKPSTPA